jgi:O-antigen/teichoic acid export membrane protein
VSAIVLCPSCNQASTHHRPPVTACSHCGAAYPDAVRAPAELALGGARAPKPALLVLGQLGTAFAGGLFLLLLALAPFDVGSYTIGDEQVSGPEFLRRAGLLFGAIGALLAAISVGLFRGRAWARPLMMIYWAVTAVALVAASWVDSADDPADLVGGLVVTAVAAGIAWWYLYRKPNVVAYFDARDPSRRRS